jgi:exonuclease SbcC
LDEVVRLEGASRQARTEASAASAARQQAERERAESREAVERARSVFRAAREPLIRLGVPWIEAGDLILCWSVLLSWIRDTISERRRRQRDAEASAGQSSARLDHELRGLTGLLAEHRLDPADHGIQLDAGQPQAVGRLPSMLMIEIERARRDRDEIARRRAEAAGLRDTIATGTEVQQVARELQTLMSSRRFPQWLADTALDTLVVDASASLLRLSSNQFDLTHERGEFYVIDHADADSRRSVRTLSGGETFQASLALALALSEQLSTLAAGGRATLDSIFLDEGFGTLDPDALETVAGTLENLAQEDRMVGVITHVQALAERVPVRFEVRRDTRTSSVERVGP